MESFPQSHNSAADQEVISPTGTISSGGETGPEAGRLLRAEERFLSAAEERHG